MSAKILSCPKCKPHEYQDIKYGQGKRVMNQTRKENNHGYRCTVCGDIVKHGGDDPKEKK